MPNHVKNVLKFKNLKPDDVDLILNMIATRLDDPKMPIERKDYMIDFDKIIPEPKTIEECPEDCIIPEEKRAHPGVEITDDRDWFNWYDWHCTYWGTKWGAYDCYTKIGKTFIKFVFSTAWNTPVPIYDRLRLLGYDFEVKFADEAYGSNCGIIKYHAEQKEFECQSADELPDADKFAENLWDRYAC